MEILMNYLIDPKNTLGAVGLTTETDSVPVRSMAITEGCLENCDSRIPGTKHLDSITNRLNHHL